MARASVILLLFSLFGGILAKDQVPVLVWNPSQEQNSIPAVPALHSVDYATFQSKYLSEFDRKNILLFIQDALSVEDLSSHATEFQALNKWMGESHALYLPSVEDPSYIAHDLASHGFNVVSLEPGVPVAGLNLKQQDNNLVVVKLPSTLTNPSRSHALQKAVEVMQNVISKIGAKREFTFIFTGIKPSVEDNSSKFEGRVRVPRAAVMPQERGYHVVNCVKLFIKNTFNLTVYNDPENPKDNYTVNLLDKESIDTGNCGVDGYVANITMKYVKDVKPFSKIIVTFNFESGDGKWSFNDVNIYLNNSNQLHTLKGPEIRDIPQGMSYSCSQRAYLVSQNQTLPKMSMILESLQVEAFFKESTGNTTFGPAWDCVGFFTVPIWVSLLTSFLLLTILTTGLYMLSDIKTMDRFDDPKGQHIMVPTSE